ncbi:MAG: hypothetical protein JWR19_929 [Pedosphaera sp.]|nr:hypothetical protein [Pedosphaera sp.]
MNRFFQRVFFVIAIAWLLFALLMANAARVQNASLLQSKTLFVAIAGSLFFLFAAFKFKTEWKFRLFMLVFIVVALEAALQATTWLGLLPGINTKRRCPYARVYWTSEGHGNSIRNRYGWYYPTFDLAAPKRIAAIGDSMVEAVEVDRTRNHAYLLQQLLQQNSPDWAVLGMGTHGTAPSYHLDVLEYAQRHFKPQEAIIYISLGANIRETSLALNRVTNEYIYYDLDAQNHLVLNPISVNHRAGFIKNLELSHQPFIYCLPMLFTSHCMTLQSVLSVRDALGRRRELAARVAAEAAAAADPTKRGLAELGLNPAPFAVNPSDDVKLAKAVLQAELLRCKEICDGYGIRLRLVTVPAFPPAFYETQKTRDWTMKIGDYDYLQPERELIAFAKEKNIELLPLGNYIQSKKMSPEEIRGLYFSNGTGHFTEQGHRLVAQAVYEAFYQTKHL